VLSQQVAAPCGTVSPLLVVAFFLASRLSEPLTTECAIVCAKQFDKPFLNRADFCQSLFRRVAIVGLSCLLPQAVSFVSRYLRDCFVVFLVVEILHLVRSAALGPRLTVQGSAQDDITALTR